MKVRDYMMVVPRGTYNKQLDNCIVFAANMKSVKGLGCDIGKVVFKGQLCDMPRELYPLEIKYVYQVYGGYDANGNELEAPLAIDVVIPKDKVITEFGLDDRLSLHAEDCIGDCDTGYREVIPGTNWIWFHTDNYRDALRWWIQLTGDEKYAENNIVEVKDNDYRFRLHR